MHDCWTHVGCIYVATSDTECHMTKFSILLDPFTVSTFDVSMTMQTTCIIVAILMTQWSKQSNLPIISLKNWYAVYITLIATACMMLIQIEVYVHKTQQNIFGSSMTLFCTVFDQLVSMLWHWSCNPQ